MIDKKRDKILKEVAQELGMQKYEVAKVVNSAFGFFFDIIEEGKFEGFYIRYLGKFIVKPNRLKKAKEKMKLRMEEEEEKIDKLNNQLDL